MTLPPSPPVIYPPAGWYPVYEGQLGWWDGTTWTYLPTPTVPRTPIGEEVRDVPATRSWLGVVVGFVVAIALTALVAFALDDVENQSNVWLVVAVVPIWLGLLSGCVVASARSQVRLSESWGLPRTRKGWVRAVAIGVGLGVAIRIAAGLAAAPFIPFLDDDSLPFGQVAPLVDVDSTFLWMFGFIAIVGAPLFEEAFFRGVLQPTLLGRLRAPVAICLQGLVFGAVHFTIGGTAMINAMTVVSITVAGIGFGWLAHWTRTLVTAVVAHATFNTIAVAFLVAYPWLEDLANA